jgi:hypothetical protein
MPLGLLLKAGGPLLKYAALIAAVFFALLFVHNNGKAQTQALWDLDVVRMQGAISAARARQAAVEVRVVTEYVDRVKVVVEKGEIIVKKVTEYVSVESDARCDVNCGFLRLYAEAAGTKLSPSARYSDDTPSGTALSAVAAGLSDNFTQCNVIREQLIALQQWAALTATTTGGQE